MKQMQCKKWWCCLSMMLGFLTGIVNIATAADVDITAEFKPSAANPSNKQFINTTPPSGYCVYYPSWCGDRQFSVELPVVVNRVWEVPGPIETMHHFTIDGRWKDVTVQSDSHTTQLRFRINFYGRSYNRGVLRPGGTPGTIGIISYGRPVYGGCPGGFSSGSERGTNHGWGILEMVQTCGATVDQTMVMGPYDGFINGMSYGYLLESPDPLTMKNGVYRGSVTYTVGPGQQFDFGPGVYNESSVTINFELTVQHQLQLEFPAGSDRVVLGPTGGWSQWLNHSQAPPALRKDMPFRIWSSGPFKVYLECEHSAAGACGLRSPDSMDDFPVNVAISMPGIYGVSSGAPVLKHRLGTDPLSAEQVQAFGYVANQRSLLHFETDAATTKEMVKYPGSRFAGIVTVVFDASF